MDHGLNNGNKTPTFPTATTARNGNGGGRSSYAMGKEAVSMEKLQP
jgi:hypothetical protein